MKTVKPRRKLPRKKESSAQNAFLEALELKGIRAWRVNSGNILAAYTNKGTGKTRNYMVKGAPKGTPDTVVHIHGPIWAYIEWKRPGESLNPDQAKWHAWATANGVLRAVHTDCHEALREVDAWRRAWGAPIADSGADQPK